MFAELLGCSCYSFLRGGSHPEEMVQRAHELGLSALGLCDRDGLYGAARAHVAARELGQRLIVGAELSMGFGPRPPKLPKHADDRMPTIALLVEDHRGYQNLCRLLTRAHADLPKGQSRSELAWLTQHPEGLFAVVPMPQRPGDETTPPPELLRTVRQVFEDHAALAIHRHRDGFDELRVEAAHAWSRRFELPIVATARPRYHQPERKPLTDVLHCIRTGATLDAAGSALSPNAEAPLRSASRMQELFGDQPEWLERSLGIAENLRFSLAELTYDFPCRLEPGESADQKLRSLVLLGLSRRYPNGVMDRVREQIERELSIIAAMQVAPYFLSTWEIVEIARERRILCQGRGSAANSAVCYALGITAVDPARSSLLFERFLSPERNEPPDIDIDFEHERREEVIQEIYRRHGRDRAAMVSEVISYRGRSALRDVGKVFGLSLDQIDRLSRTISYWDEPGFSTERLTALGFDGTDPRLMSVVRWASALRGFPRHLSIHVGGFVLSASPLDRVAPIEPARMVDRSVIPWDKDDLDALGFFKIDVLGLGMLTAIRKALTLIHEDGGLRSGTEKPFDPLEVVTRIPAEEPAVYAMLSRADTVGVFQIESRAQMAMLPRLRPRCFYDLVIEVAIVRPGPIQGGMVHPYLKRRNGEAKVVMPHPELHPILDRTLGVPLFQEQVMQIAIVGAGYSGGDADQLRRDMAAWKRSGKLLRHRDRLLRGFAEKGIAREFGEALFEQIKGFGDYGFPESHAASFALLVYASSWQKLHYPAHFACALLNAQPMGFYSPATILADARRHGVQVRDVDVTRSLWDCTLEPAEPQGSTSSAPARALRIGFRLVKGFGEKSARRLEAARSEWRFSSIEDVARRAELRRDEIDALAEAGAFESLVVGRRQALWKSRSPRLEGLFDSIEMPEPGAELPPLNGWETLLFDHRRKGFAVDDHPMRHLRTRLKAQGVLSSQDLTGIEAGRTVQVAGVVICRQRPATASGVVFMTLEDETGFSNLVLWRDVFERFWLPAMHGSILLAAGKVERQAPGPDSGNNDVIHLMVQRLERLDGLIDPIRSQSRDFH